MGGEGATVRIGFVGSFGTVHEVVQMAVEAEQHGWDGFFTWDGVDLGGAMGDTSFPVWDPWAVLAAAAVRTERITLGALVFAVPRRRPWVLAKQAVTVDHLSGGRLVLPVGLGVPDDRAVAGVRGEAVGVRERAERLDDALALLDRSWRGETFDLDGTHVHVEGMRLLPRPVERPDGRHRIPVWPVAAFPSARSMGRAVRWDGVVPQLRGDRAMDPMTPQDVAEVVAWAREHRDPAAGPFDVVVQGVLPDDPAEAADLVGGLAQAGATWFVDSRWDPQAATPERLLARLRLGPPDLGPLASG
ncbi:LLM class flavin-dependent oxidoreductase [Cellulomonas oligotrophica]|uniref:Alkanesulfonate monooxygenase SsuD/methylene tetrahydromethanopterin reductase-like flavin-dependent oxidoreductase (Luciferase family) n=1 Tax=Cellulomonas oligotrophica TaxID=931536 RepID=A0A7Y9FI98_9CELL|nr:LLM class flavin-dependent oxidoreductase [Cellulomonas oligotrophica]NYD86461.1 alkanesulfonate monooxygenase SsuD/methylene tetrahydromethanopterin reductase-like flavin-dependent oxidoreductase (luciferase family) [Cellulomonas oligotrophica]